MEEERGEEVLERGNPAGAYVIKKRPGKIGLGRGRTEQRIKDTEMDSRRYR